MIKLRSARMFSRQSLLVALICFVLPLNLALLVLEPSAVGSCSIISPASARSKTKPEIVDLVDEKDQAKINAKLKNTSAVAHYKKPGDYVSSRILINAPVEIVWKMVHEERESAPNLVYSKLHKEDSNLLVFEQKWTIVPFIATTTCVISENEIPYKRIDYKVIKSNQFKVMEGAWVFTPINSGSDAVKTELELTTHLELRRLAPMKIVNAMAKRKIEQRLAHIKELAEKPHANLDVDGRVLAP
ncbi:SRPBCC family protein [bacterium]|nr:SRPBCC family protein [bacterium]